MPNYPQQQMPAPTGYDARDRITQALMDIQQPQPMAQMPTAQTAPLSSPGQPAMGAPPMPAPIPGMPSGVPPMPAGGMPPPGTPPTPPATPGAMPTMGQPSAMGRQY